MFQKRCRAVHVAAPKQSFSLIYRVAHHWFLALVSPQKKSREFPPGSK